MNASSTSLPDAESIAVAAVFLNRTIDTLVTTTPWQICNTTICTAGILSAILSIITIWRKLWKERSTFFVLMSLITLLDFLFNVFYVVYQLSGKFELFNIICYGLAFSCSLGSDLCTLTLTAHRFACLKWPHMTVGRRLAAWTKAICGLMIGVISALRFQIIFDRNELIVHVSPDFFRFYKDHVYFYISTFTNMALPFVLVVSMAFFSGQIIAVVVRKKKRNVQRASMTGASGEMVEMRRFGMVPGINGNGPPAQLGMVPNGNGPAVGLGMVPGWNNGSPEPHPEDPRGPPPQDPRRPTLMDPELLRAPPGGGGSPVGGLPMKIFASNSILVASFNPNMEQQQNRRKSSKNEQLDSVISLVLLLDGLFLLNQLGYCFFTVGEIYEANCDYCSKGIQWRVISEVISDVCECLSHSLNFYFYLYFSRMMKEEFKVILVGVWVKVGKAVEKVKVMVGGGVE